MFTWRTLLISAAAMLPIIFIACLVTPVTAPVEIDINRDAATARVETLYEIFDDLANPNASTNYTKELLASWVQFGGNEDEEIEGAYTALYNEWYTATEHHDEMWLAFYNARASFLRYYTEYNKYIKPVPKVFIERKHFNALTRGTEELYTLLCKNTYPTVDALNTARKAMTDVRIDVDFRAILSGAQAMFLTHEQCENLKNHLGEFEQKRTDFETMGIISDAQYVSFCDMIYEIISYEMDGYVIKNADFSASKYYGFSVYDRQLKSVEIKKYEYMVDNNMFAVDYSNMPKGIAFKDCFGVMNKNVGTSMPDFIHNAMELVWLVAPLFLVAIVMLCVTTDIRRKTILGTIASPHSRKTIFWSKMFMCIFAFGVFTAISVFCFWFTATLNASVSLAVPPHVVLAYFGGDLIFVVPSIIALCIYFTGLLLKAFVIFSLIAFLSLAVKNHYVMGVVCSLCIVGFIVADVFLRPFVFYEIIFYPLALLMTVVFIRLAHGLFIHKEYL
jgi:hypothetical protein